MQLDKDPPYFRVAEVIRAIARVLDTKSSGNSKKLDEMASQNDIDCQDIESSILEFIEKPLAKYTGEDFSSLVSSSVRSLIDEYLDVVGRICVDGITRNHASLLLQKYFFPNIASEFLLKAYKEFGGPNPIELMSNDNPATHTAFIWISKNENNWEKFIGCLEKTEKDKIASWSNGKYLISLGGISWMKSLDREKYVNWDKAIPIIFIARSIDVFREHGAGNDGFNQVRHAMLGVKYREYDKQASEAVREYATRNHVAWPLILAIGEGLQTGRRKDPVDQKFLRSLIDQARRLVNPDGSDSGSYWLDWHEGIWYVAAGDIEAACRCYEKAFDGCLYRSGNNQKMIIEEAMVVAASLENPKMVFLKRLKKAAMVFKYEPNFSITSAAVKKNKAQDVFEDWEVGMWARQFDSYFPSDGYFEGVSFGRNSKKSGLSLFSVNGIEKPYLQHPDRRTLINGIRTPQLVRFSEIADENSVRALLESGADVNVYSKAGDTPILVALEMLNVFNNKIVNVNEEIFNVLSGYDHDKEIINMRSDRGFLLPIISAIGSGRPDVVKKIIAMGADVNRRGLVDEITPLGYCLRCIYFVTHPEALEAIYRDVDVTPDLLSSVRRNTRGAYGLTVDDQFEPVRAVIDDPEHIKVRLVTCSRIQERIRRNCSVDHFHDIAKMLLEYGADLDMDICAGIPGFTSRMSVDELGDVYILELMNSVSNVH